MKKFLSSILVFMLVIASFTVYSNAADAAIKLAPSSSTVTVGKEFNVILSLTNLGPFTNGINSASGTLTYDSNYVSYVSISGQGSWGVSQFNQSNGKFLALTSNMDLVGTGPILSIKFKLNSLPSETTKLVTLNNVSITDGETDEIEFSTVSVTIKAQEPAPVNNTVTNNIVNNIVNNTVHNTVVNNTVNNIVNNTINNTVENNTINNIVENNVINNTVNNTVNDIVINIDGSNTSKNQTTVALDDSTTNKVIPYTGFNTFIIIAIVASIASGIYAYYKYKNLNI